jgi:cytosine/adenosine deaminase-related metal-dependent hydrolase
MAADIVGFDLRGLNHAGALHDPLAALLFAAPATVSFNMINGRFVVRDGELLTADVPSLVTRHNDLAATLLAG